MLEDGKHVLCFLCLQLLHSCMFAPLLFFFSSPPSLSLFKETLESFKLKWQAERMNLYFLNFFPAINEIPKAPRGRYSRNTRHGQFVNACMESEHKQTHTATHIQMFVLTQPAHQLSKKPSGLLFFPACSSPFLSYSSVLLSKERSVRPPFIAFENVCRRFKYS